MRKVWLKKSLVMNRWLVSLTFVFCAWTVSAAGASTDYLQQTGKIYVVVMVIIAVFIGLAWYLFRLDQKVRRLEQKHLDE